MVGHIRHSLRSGPGPCGFRPGRWGRGRWSVTWRRYWSGGRADLQLFDDGVGEQGLGHPAHLGVGGLVELTVDLDLEALALADLFHALEAQPRTGRGDRLTLGIQDLRLEHDVHDDAGHWVLQMRSRWVWPGHALGSRWEWGLQGPSPEGDDARVRHRAPVPSAREEPMTSG